MIVIITLITAKPLKKKASGSYFSFLIKEWLKQELADHLAIILENITGWKVSVFGVIVVSIFLHSDWMWENTDWNNSEYGHFSNSVYLEKVHYLEKIKTHKLTEFKSLVKSA